MALQYNINLTPSTGANAVFNIMAWLAAQSWTIPTSSDGLTYNPSGQQITTSGAGAGGMSNLDAWWVGQIPGGSKAFCFQRGSTNQLWRVKYSPNNGFIVGSPTATVTPTATDQVVILGGGTDAAPTFANLFAGDGTYRLEIVADNAAPYNFFSVAFPIASGIANNCNHAFFMDSVANVFATDTDPFAVSAGGGAAGYLGSLLGTTETVYGQVNGTVQAMSIIPYPVGWQVDPTTGFDQDLPLVYQVATLYQKGQSTLFKWNTCSNLRQTPSLMTNIVTSDTLQMGWLLLPWNSAGITN